MKKVEANMLEPCLYDHNTYKPAFFVDLNSSLASVVIHAPYLTPRAIEQFKDVFMSCAQRGVQVCVFAQEPQHWEERHLGVLTADTLARLNRTETAIALLRSYGVHVSLRKKIHEKLAIIDETILWDGSLNILSHYDTTERMHRWVRQDKVEEAIRMHKLDTCEECSQSEYHVAFSRNPELCPAKTAAVAGRIQAKRKQMRLSQRDLARKLKVSKNTIGRVEAGMTDVDWGTLARICQEIGLELIVIPRFVIPSIEKLIQESEEFVSSMKTAHRNEKRARSNENRPRE